jgi:hypothetical protein
MRFEGLKQADKELLSQHEAEEVAELVAKGGALLRKLEKPHTFEELSELIKYYAGSVNFRRQLLERIVDRTLKKKKPLTQVNDIIENTEELILILKAAKNVEEAFRLMKSRLNKMLDDYSVEIKLDQLLKFWIKDSVLRRKEIIISFDDLSAYELLALILRNNHQLIIKGFLMSEQDVINAGIVKDFLEGVNEEELMLALKEDPKHADFLLSAYVMLRHQARRIRSLANQVNDRSLADSESELNSNIALLRRDLSKVAGDLKKSLIVLNEARDSRVKTQRLISVYNEDELMSDPKKIILSFLKSEFKVKDLLNQLMYEYLVTNDSIPESLGKYRDFNNRSQLLMAKNFFLKQSS